MVYTIQAFLVQGPPKIADGAILYFKMTAIGINKPPSATSTPPFPSSSASEASWIDWPRPWCETRYSLVAHWRYLAGQRALGPGRWNANYGGSCTGHDLSVNLHQTKKQIGGRGKENRIIAVSRVQRSGVRLIANQKVWNCEYFLGSWMVSTFVTSEL